MKASAMAIRLNGLEEGAHLSHRLLERAVEGNAGRCDERMNA